MTDPKKPTPVAILVVPQLDKDGNPECRGCAFQHWDSYEECTIGEGLDEVAPVSFSGPIRPGPKCPVHGGPETRATPF